MALSYTIGFKADTSEITSAINEIESDIKSAFSDSGAVMTDAMSDGIRQASILSDALKKAQTVDGTSYITLNANLKAAGTSAAEMAAALQNAGMTKSLNTMLTQFAAADKQLISVNAKIAEMQRVLGQSIKFNLAMGVQNFFIQNIQSAVSWVQELDTALHDIAVVAPDVASDMEALSTSIVQNASDLRVAASEYAEAALIFYQQGLSQEEVDARSEYTIMAAKASGTAVEEMSSQLTAIWNTYQMEGEEMGRAASVAAELGAKTAASFADIADGMQIAASGASMLGVSYDSLAAIMSTVVSVTQQSSSTVATAYKTIFARFSNLSTSGEDAGESLGTITQSLADMGINVLDASGSLKDLDIVIQECGEGWDNYSRNQQIAIAQTVGGTRQYQQFLALMQNYDEYLNNLEIAESTIDTSALVQQYETAIETIDTAMTNSSEAWNEAFSQIFTSDSQIGFYNTLESVGETAGEVIETLGGLEGILTIGAAILSTKIVPYLFQGGTAIKTWVSNLTLAGQQNTVVKDTEKMNSQMDALTQKALLANKMETEKIQSRIVLEQQELDLASKKAAKAQAAKVEADEELAAQEKVLTNQEEEVANAQELLRLAQQRNDSEWDREDYEDRTAAVQQAEVLRAKEEEIVAAKRQGATAAGEAVTKAQEATVASEGRLAAEQRLLTSAQNQRAEAQFNLEIFKQKQIASQQAANQIAVIDNLLKQCNESEKIGLLQLREQISLGQMSVLTEIDNLTVNQKSLQASEKLIASLQKRQQLSEEEKADLIVIEALTQSIQKYNAAMLTSGGDSEAMDAAKGEFETEVSLVLNHESVKDVESELIDTVRQMATNADVDILDSLASGERDLTAAIENCSAAQKLGEKNTQTLTQGLAAGAAASEEYAKAQRTLNASLAAFQKQQIAALPSGQMMVQQLSTTLGGVTMLSSGLTSLQSAIEGDTLSLASFLTIITQVTSGIGMMVKPMTTFKQAIDSVTAARKLSAEATKIDAATEAFLTSVQAEGMNVDNLRALAKASNIELTKGEGAAQIQQALIEKGIISLDQAQLSLEGLQALAKEKNIDLIRETTAEELRATLIDKGRIAASQTHLTLEQLQIIAKDKDIAVTQDLTAAELRELLANEMMIPVKGTLTATMQAQTVAVLQTAAAWWALLWPFAAAIAAAAALVGIFYLLADAHITAAEKMENTAEAANNLTTAFADAKTAAEDLASSIEVFQGYQDAMEGLAKGTDEWAEALQNANEAAIELLNTYPELYELELQNGGVITRENGNISISDDGLEAIQTIYDQKANTAMSASYIANQEARKAETTHSVGEQVVNASAYDYNGVDQSYTVEKALTATLENSSGEKSSDVEAYAAALADAGIIDPTLIQRQVEAFEENYDEMSKLATAMEANTLATQIENEAIAAALLESDVTGNDEYGDEVIAASAKVFDTLQSDAYDEAYAAARKRSFTAGTAESKAAMAEYAEIQGIDGLNVTNYKNNGNVEYEYTDESGEVQTAEITSDQIASVLAASAANEAFAEATESIIDNFQMLSSSIDAADSALMDFLGDGDILGATGAEIEALKAEMESSEGYAAGEEYLLKLAIDENENIDEIAARYGYTTGTAMIEAINAEIADAEAAFEETTKQFTEAKTQISDKSNGDDKYATQIAEIDKLESGLGTLGAEASKQLADLMDAALSGSQGTEGVATIAEGFNQILSVAEEGTDEYTEIMETLATVDWTDPDAANTLINLFDMTGLAIGMTDEELKEFCKDMLIVNNVSPLDAINDLVASFSDLYSIMADVSFGDIFSDEDYQSIIAYDAALKDLFLTMADGTMKYIGEDDGLIDSISLEQNIADLEAASKAYNDFANGNWTTTTKKYENGRSTTRTSAVDWGDYAAGDQDVTDMISTAKNLASDSSSAGMLSTIEYDSDRVLELADNLDQAQTAYQNYLKTKGSEGFSADELDRLSEALDSATNDMAIFYGEVDEFANNTSLEDVSSTVKEMWASTAKSVDELEIMLQNNLIDVEQFDKALENAFSVEVEALGLDYDEVSDYADYLQEAATKSELLSDELENNEDAAKDVAVAVMRLNNGIEAMGEGIEDWTDMLTNSDASAEEYYEALTGVRSALSDMLNVDPSALSADFLTNAVNLSLMAEAAAGSVAALEELQILAAESYIIDIIVANGLENQQEAIMSDFNSLVSMLDNADFDVSVGATIDDADFVEQANKIIAASGMTAEEVNDAFSMIGLEPNLVMTEVTQPMTTPITTTVNEFSTRTEKYWDEVDGQQVLNYKTLPTVTSWTEQTGTHEYTGTVMVPSLDVNGGDGSAASSFVVTSSPSMSNYSSTNSGGNSSSDSSSSSSSPSSSSRSSGSSQRYTDNNAAIDSASRSLEKLDTVESNSTGQTKLAALSAKTVALQNQAKAYTALADEAKAYYELDDGGAGTSFGVDTDGIEVLLEGVMGDADRLQQKLSSIGLGVDQTVITGLYVAEFDEDGFVTNTQEIMNSLYAEADAFFNEHQVFEWDDDGVKYQVFDSDENEAAYDAIISQIESINDQISTVEDTAQEVIDAIQTQLDLIFTWMDNKIAEAQYKVELRVTLNELDIKIVDNALTLLGDEQYTVTIDYITENAESTLSTAAALKEEYERYQEIIANINSDEHQEWFVSEFGEEAWAQYLENGTVPEALFDAMTENIDNLWEVMETLNEYNEEVWATWGDALETVADQFDVLITKFDSYSSQLESWQTIWEIAGDPYEDASVSIDLMNDELKVQATLMKSLQTTYTSAVDQLATTQSLYEEAVAVNGADSQIAQDYADLVVELEQEVLDSKTEMLSEAASYLETLEEVCEAAAEVIVDSFTDALDGLFADLESAAEMLDQFTSIDTYFATDTDAASSIYSMLEEVQTLMANTTDPSQYAEYAAWEEYLSSMIEEKTVQMEIMGEMQEVTVQTTKDGVELTATELEIMEAEFELMKTQAAWEEAQANKDTMRLARDASGNYSYVYSSDEEEDTTASDINAQLAEIMSLHEQAADEAAEMWLSTMEAYREYVAEIDWQRYEEDSAYKDEIDQRCQWYENQMDLYSATVETHNAAINRSFEDTALGVILDLDDMSDANDYYKANTAEMSAALQANYIEYQETASEALEDIGISEEDLKEVVVEESEDIMEQNTTTGESVEELYETSSSYLSQIETSITSWASTWEDSCKATISWIEDVIASYKEMLEVMNGDTSSGSYDASNDYTADLYSGYSSGMTSTDYASTTESLYNKVQAVMEGSVDDWIASGGTEESYNSLKSAISNGTYYNWTDGMSYSEFLAANNLVSAEDYSQYVEDIDDLGTAIASATTQEAFNALVLARWEKIKALDYEGALDADASGKLEDWQITLTGYLEDGFDAYAQAMANTNSNIAAYTTTYATGGLATEPQVALVAEEGKELILNPADTENMLLAIEIMRDSIAQYLSNLGSTQGASISNITGDTNTTSTQQIIINAEFPNVSTRDEIEAAFANLVNEAVQYELK